MSRPPRPRRSRSVLRRLGARRGQSVVEYMVGISVVVIGIAVGFLALGETTRGVFDNARRTIQLPYP